MEATSKDFISDCILERKHSHKLMGLFNWNTKFTRVSTPATENFSRLCHSKRMVSASSNVFNPVAKLNICRHTIVLDCWEAKLSLLVASKRKELARPAQHERVLLSTLDLHHLTESKKLLWLKKHRNSV